MLSLRTQLLKPVQTRISRNTEPLRARVPSDATVSPGKQNTSILWYKEAGLVLNSALSLHAHFDRLSSLLAFSNQLNPSNSHLRHLHTLLSPFFYNTHLHNHILALHSHSLKIVEDLVPTLLLFSYSSFLYFLSLVSVSQTAHLTFISLEPFTPTYLAPYPSILSALLLGMLHAS
jgi:hypothetical protein